MSKFGLPTYPIYSGMTVGNREPEEIEWLLDHGVIQSDLYRYRKILKVDRSYHLVRNADDRYSSPDTEIAEATDLQDLIDGHNLNIAWWYWYESEKSE